MPMLRSLKDIKGYGLSAQDGDIGRCSDFLFDDQDWAVRYIVADTQKWLPGRKVLISPISIGDADASSRSLSVGLTRDQIKDSPPLDSDAPVSRRYEKAFNQYYDWGGYWGGPSVWGPHLYPRLLNRAQERLREASEKIENNVTLRSVREVMGYAIQATDTDIGHVEDYIVDLGTWIIRYLVIDTRNLLPGGKKVLVSPQWVELVDWRHRKVVVSLTRTHIEKSPEFDPSVPVNRKYETVLYDFYGRPYYW
ncbi:MULTISPECIES: hypothetical protein [Desulfococcus]|uniref:PRC-barrel domain protein n=1 Tax=Desulfococcus multivorans DSM 2059 TaxID=1121405 RepID=S7U0H0_DESML|nr:hypothetical protein [Desulfococcus multivorans]AOY58256.1 conserved uncharacterized protein [Desulfococcus multivorans]EPR42490.1 hypothetical protein dsmv_1616 [Desulfococcus multivorans DSM 2059]MDX9817436.1 hypothetical protein [Desulfococcus multivorans]SJZ97594.1 hypothetical protein SAMN02745446_02284 [Desulfococcus multivorans DSM 2059]